MHTIDSALSISLILLIVAMLLLSMPGLYAGSRDLCVSGVTADRARLDRDRLLVVGHVGSGAGSLPVVSSSPETVFEWVELAGEAYREAAERLDGLVRYFKEVSR